MIDFDPPYRATSSGSVVDAHERLVCTADERTAEKIATLLNADAIGYVPLPGWTCPKCGVLNGAMKQILPNCRACDTPWPGARAV